MLKKYVATKDTHFYPPLELLMKIDEFTQNYHKNSRSDGIVDLLNIGLFCVENWQKVQNPDIVDEIHRQLEESTIVDKIQSMNRKQFDILYSIFETEQRDRYGKKNIIIKPTPK